MDAAMHSRIVGLMKRHNVMTIATVRKDGYPQATTVTYVNDGLNIYFGCERTAQKVKNIRRCAKVSLTIDRDYRNWNQIKGLSMAADAEVLTDRDEIRPCGGAAGEEVPAVGPGSTRGCELRESRAEGDLGAGLHARLRAHRSRARLSGTRTASCVTWTSSYRCIRRYYPDVRAFGLASRDAPEPISRISRSAFIGAWPKASLSK